MNSVFWSAPTIPGRRLRHVMREIQRKENTFLCRLLDLDFDPKCFFSWLLGRASV